ncbi:hypothetical protein CcCBS67573_g05508 [Chytriomyces confervae]|uniref:Uncharacterized protein n=1 Tax=Chytriomyces confervae TaxID=246404 RepID=A0A507FAQ5_9FUNG|nr:hypothetical protein HDU80_005663 [Chytriomyces hyalinus]TPX73222.1 hypothetical protein CcCBS67573_g05508 [Chytriomyces confervae]
MISEAPTPLRGGTRASSESAITLVDTPVADSTDYSDTAPQSFPHVMSRFRATMIDPLITKWKNARSRPVQREKVPDIPASMQEEQLAPTKAPLQLPAAVNLAVVTSEAENAASRNPNVVAFIHASYSNQATISTSVEVIKDHETILSPISDTLIQDASDCFEFLMGRSDKEFKSSSSWFRVPPPPEELRAITDVGFKAYCTLRNRQKTATGVEPGATTGTQEKQWPANANVSCNIIAGYLKRVLARVPGGIVTESMRKMILDLHDGGSTVNPRDKAILSCMWRLNPARRALALKVSLLAQKILSADKVSASQLAVVLPVTNVNACGGGEAAFLVERIFGGDGAERDAQDASDMRALVDLFDAWNRIVGVMYTDPDAFFGEV